MRPIHDTHVEQPGLAIVDVMAADDATAFAVQDLLAASYAITPGDRTVHKPGEPGVRLRLFLDRRQEPG
ncbi:DUF6207 family protein [Streptomyces sp. NPDC050759]|uniref:DUF6207 family protein n=1 Tax=Streptomyces sp. NPDC050759 TaxID=3365635 RepID=UPI00379A5994